MNDSRSEELSPTERLHPTQHPSKSVSFARSTLTPFWKSLPAWVFVSLLTNGLLITLMTLVVLREPTSSVTLSSSTSIPPHLLNSLPSAPTLGPRHQLTYQQWVDLLGQEADAAAKDHPQRLTVLAGDSLTLWFPPELLPSSRTWLNQGISGETSAGLLRRLDLFKRTQPETIFVMIGINDLIQQVHQETLLANQRQILQDLREDHPDTQIVVQSILPHGGEKITWERRDRLLSIPNSQIRSLNTQLQAIAQEEDVYYLDLYPLFADPQGDLRLDLSTDGLHLNPEGYWVWRTALEMYDQIKLEPDRH